MSRLLTRRGVRDALLGAALVLAAVSLVLWPQQSIEAAREGLGLCANVIIPSLFPFFVLAGLVVELGLAEYVGRALEGVMYPLFRVPGACASALALGFVGGYPVGARTAISLYETGLCSKTEAERLLAFCNNSGPAFILGVVGAGVFCDSRVGVWLYLAHALASVCVGLVFRFYKGSGGSGSVGRFPRSPIRARRLSAAFTETVKSSFLSTLNICSFVVFFTVVIRMLTASGILPVLAKALTALFGPLGMTEEWSRRLLTGLLEISSGVWSLNGEGSFGGRLSMAAFMLGWAGISVHCQVLSFLGDSRLAVGTYLTGKMLHAGLSALFVCFLVRVVPLEEQVSAYLTEQVDGIAAMDFSAALTLSTVCAWLVWLAFFALAAVCLKKCSGKRLKHRV